VREHLGVARSDSARARARAHVHATTANISCHVESEAIRHHPLVIRVESYTRARRRRIGADDAQTVSFRNKRIITEKARASCHF